MARWIPLIITANLGAFAAPALAFNAWGFHSGMTFEQATSAAKQQGYIYEQEGDLTGFHRNGSNNLDYLVSFCDGRLHWISLDYNPTIANLVDVIEDLTRSYGPPLAEAKSQVTPDGRFRSLSLVFTPRPDDKTVVFVSVNGANDTLFNIQVTHESTHKCKSPPTVP